MAWISAVFFCLGAADTLLGDRLGVGNAFRQGFAAVVDLLLLMTGFMALAPWLGTHLAPVITPVFSAVGCDPSLFASLFLSCDAGGAVLAAQIAQEPAAGLYNGLIVSAFLGATINGTIPLALGQFTIGVTVREMAEAFTSLPNDGVMSKGRTGLEVQELLDRANITANKNTIPKETQSVKLTSGMRFGSPAVTSRGMKEDEMRHIGRLIAQLIEQGDEAVAEAKEQVIELCRRFPLYPEY